MSKKDFKRVGNFKISVEKGMPYDRIKVETESGNWSMKFTHTNGMFNSIRELANSEEPSCKEYLEKYLILMYTITNCTPDGQLFDDMFNSITAYNERMKSFVKDLTKEEDDKELEVAKQIYELQKQSEDENI